MPATAMREDEPCFWCHSSGSSGRPKAVMHAHRFASQVPRVAVSAPEVNAWYECDLIGMTVADETGHELGCLDTIWDLPAHPVLVVKQCGREVLIPAVKEFVRSIDVAQGRMTVRTIEGLVEA